MSTRPEQYTLMLGALPVENGTRFSVWAPNATRVDVRVRTGAAVGDYPLTPSRSPNGRRGVFSGVIPGVRAGDDYALRLDGGDERPDPASRWQPHGVHGASRVVDPDSFPWRDEGWAGIDMADHVLYELHVGTFTPEGTFDAVIPRLASLRELGITTIEIMPVAQFPGDRNWGYDGVSLYAVQNSYGGPDALKRLVNAAHAEGLAVALDVVYNHFGPEGNYLAEFGPYFTDTYRTPWGKAVNYDGPDSDEVRSFVIENACYWVREFHIDALRLDAIHGIFDFQANHILAELTERVHETAAELERKVQVIGESDLNDPRLVRSEERGGLGLDAQWSDDFHHAVHVALTGESAGYYKGFHEYREGVVHALRFALARRFAFEGQYASHRRRRHGAPAVDVSADHFVIFIQNHDQVGNRAAGERLDALLSPDARRLAAALLLLAPYVPLLFMGEEYGEPAPFLYFVSHSDPQLIDAVRKGRREEFESFGWADDVPDPQSTHTFERSRIHFELAHEGEHAELRALYRELIAIRREEPALRPGAAEIVVSGSKHTVVMRLDAPNARSLLALFNLGATEETIPLRHDSGNWKLRFATHSTVSVGTEWAMPPGVSDMIHVTYPHGESAGGEKEVLFITLPPLAAALYYLDNA